MKKLFCVLLAAVLFLASSCKERTDSSGIIVHSAVIESELAQFRAPQTGDYIATISTSKGDITALLFAEYAPQAAENFRLQAGAEYYNGTDFHRIKAGFVIQGGDATGTGFGLESFWGQPYPIELSTNLYHFSGALCAVSASPFPGEVGSQFYIVATKSDNCADEEVLERMKNAGYDEAVVDAYRQAGGAFYLDGKDTVFGQVLLGMDVVQKISSVAIDKDGKPATKVEILKVTVTQYSA